jgi:hypothetical protein
MNNIWSFSRLTTADDCLYSYWSRYEAKEPQENNAWGIGGGHTHDILEKGFKGEIQWGKEAADLWADTLPILDFPSMTTTYVSNYINQSYDFIQSFKGVNNKVLSVEREFEIDIRGNLLRGFIDLETETENGDLVITDWKSSSKSSFVGKKLAPKARQLYLYAESCKQHYGKYPKEMYFYLYREKLPIKIEWKQEGADEAIEWMCGVIEKVKNATSFPPKPQADFFCFNVCGVKSCVYKTK